MNQIQLQIIDKTESGYHVKLFLDGKNSGILYLTEEQFYFVRKALQAESYSQDKEFEVVDPFEEEISEDELD